jgi:hypothetical protein
MKMASKASKAGSLAERLLGNQYAQDNVREAVGELRGAYARASKRRVRPAEDAKVREQLNRAAESLGDAVRSVRTGRQKPKPRRGRRVLVVVGVGAVGVAAALAASEELRNAVFGEGSAEPAPSGRSVKADASEAVPV